MDKITVQQAAEKWGVSPRRVQDLCKRGEITGAVLWHRSWMIPSDAEYPTKKENIINEDSGCSALRQTPFLNMTDLYSKVGMADECIAALADNPEAQALFAAEIAYSRGEINKVIEQAKYFLNSRLDVYAVNAGGMLLALCAMWKGDVLLWREAKKRICEAPAKSGNDNSIMALSLACINSAIRDLSDYPKWFTIGKFGHLPPDSHPAARIFYIKYLLVFAQDMAKSRMKLPDVTGLGLMKTIPYIAEPMIAQAQTEKTVVPEIYLRLLVAVAYHQCGDDASAVEHIDKAIELALPDRLLGILAEHRRQLDYLLDDRLELASPQACRKYKELHKGLLEGWTMLHNELLSRNVSKMLTVKEREIARLAAFGLTNPQIAKQLNVSVDTAKQAVYDIMNKTGANSRDELGEYV